MKKKINIFNYANLKEITSKTPAICFYSETGACGPSGLLFVIFEDKTLYAYSAFYRESDLELVREIINHVPEMRSLIYLDSKHFKPKRERRSNMEQLYLGLGNHALVDEKFKIPDHDGITEYRAFIKTCEKYLGRDLGDLLRTVEDAITKKK